MRVQYLKTFRDASSHRCFDYAAVQGVEEAFAFARLGRLISAIKHLEAANPGISRGEARLIVESSGFGHQLRWPEEDKQPLRCL